MPHARTEPLVRALPDRFGWAIEIPDGEVRVWGPRPGQPGRPARYGWRGHAIRNAREPSPGASLWVQDAPSLEVVLTRLGRLFDEHVWVGVADLLGAYIKQDLKKVVDNGGGG